MKTSPECKRDMPLKISPSSAASPSTCYATIPFANVVSKENAFALLMTMNIEPNSLKSLPCPYIHEYGM
jgi:hypothetical protein